MPFNLHLLATAALPLAAHAAQLPNPVAIDNLPAGVLNFPIDPPPALKLGRRQLQNGLTRQLDTPPLINLAIGNSKQKFQLALDTGSHVMWISPNCGLSHDPQACCARGTLANYDDATLSSSENELGEDASYAMYGGKKGAMLQYFSDTVFLGSQKVTNQTFGLAAFSQGFAYGVLGLAPSPFVSPKDGPRTQLMHNLVDQNLIKSQVFGLNTPSIHQDPGALTLGGVDRAKFSGTLKKFPILPNLANRFMIQVDGFSVKSPDDSQPLQIEKSARVVISSFNSGVSLPQDMLDMIISAFPKTTVSEISSNATDGDPWDRNFACPGGKPNTDYLEPDEVPDTDETDNFTMVDCAYAQLKKSVDFRFGDLTISVPLGDFVTKNSKGECFVGAFPIESKDSKEGAFLQLGLPFMRHAYIVFDRDNQEIWMAPAANCGSQVEAVGSGPDAVGPLQGSCPEPDDC